MPRPPGLPKTGGRVRGRPSLSREERNVLTSEMAADILKTYKKMGGPRWLLKWAQQNENEFMRQCLARLLPAFPKEDPDIQINQQFNSGSLSDFEVAQRIAFTLNKGVHTMGQGEILPVVSPQEACRIETPQELPPVEVPVEPEPVERPKSFRDEEHYREWCEQTKMTPEQQALIHRPSAAEQGLVSTPGSNGIRVVRRKR